MIPASLVEQARSAPIEPAVIARAALWEALCLLYETDPPQTLLSIVEVAMRQITRMGDGVDAADRLSDTAIWVRGLDPDAVQAALARGVAAGWEDIWAACRPAIQPEPEPRDVPESTIEAAEYLRRQGDATALRRWLDACPWRDEILEGWRHG